MCERFRAARTAPAGPGPASPGARAAEQGSMWGAGGSRGGRATANTALVSALCLPPVLLVTFKATCVCRFPGRNEPLHNSIGEIRYGSICCDLVRFPFLLRTPVSAGEPRSGARWAGCVSWVVGNTGSWALSGSDKKTFCKQGIANMKNVLLTSRTLHTHTPSLRPRATRSRPTPSDAVRSLPS